MSMINVSLVGNLTRDPEQFTYAADKVKVTLRVAVDFGSRYSKQMAQANGDNTTEYYKVEMWGKLGDLAMRTLMKGSRIGVTGKLIMEHWTDNEGRERLTPCVSATQLALPPRPGRTGNAAEPVNQHTADSFAPTASMSHASPAEPPEDDSYRSYVAPQAAEDELFVGAKVVSVSEPRSVYRPRYRHR